MGYSDRLLIQPGEVGDVTGQLAGLTDRVRQVMQAEAPNLTVVSPARDEVSQRVAATMNQVHTSFVKASDQGCAQVQDLVAVLRSHTGDVVAADEGPAV